MTSTIKASLHVKVYTDEALQILKSLEAAQMIGLHETDPDAAQTKRLKQIEGLFGSITQEEGQELLRQTKEMREEWNRP
jgi:hypothetical protein